MNRSGKTAIKLLIPLLLIISGCRISVDTASVSRGEKCFVSVSVNLNGSRTALPSSLNFAEENYTYSLSCTGSSENETLIFSGISYADLSGSYGIYSGTWDFTLTVSSEISESVIIYTSELRNTAVSEKNTNLAFTLQPVKGYETSGAVTIILPEEGVYAVKAGVSSSPAATESECEIMECRELSIDSTEPSAPEAVFSSTEFKTGTTQFVIFFLYDKHGQLISSVPESVVSFYGKKSVSVIKSEDYSLYGMVSYSLVLTGTPSKTYYTAEDQFSSQGLKLALKCSNGKSFAVDFSDCTTNLESLSGIDQTLTVYYDGMSADVETKINRATYRFTESPVPVDYSESLYAGTEENPAVFYEFGDFPQSRKADDISVSSVTASCGYYIGSDGNYYQLFNSSYYRIEPIVWRVLNTKKDSSDSYETTGKAFLFAESCIDGCQTFCDSKSTRTIDGTTVYSTNWEYSNVRAYLNGLNGSAYSVSDYSTDGGFIKKAFTSAGRTRIFTTLVDNSPASNTLDTVPSDYCSSNTEDKVFLLSIAEISNGDYGFNTSAKTDDDARKRYRTDYTDSRVYTDGGYAHYWLRSALHSTFYKGNNARYVKEGGNPDNYDGVDCTDKGVVPALWVSLNGYVDSLIVTGTLSKQYYLKGETLDTAGITVTYYDGEGKASEISSDDYTTNFEGLSGANNTLLISYKGLTAEVDQLVHKASYQFTEKPVKLENYSGTAGTDASYYKFGDFPQSSIEDGISLSPQTAPNGYYIGTDGNFYALYDSSYYLVEPLVWRALKEDGEKAFLFSEKSVEADVPFYWSDSVSTDEDVVRRYSGEHYENIPGYGEDGAGLHCYGYAAQIYPNNYEYSTIRAYLNGIDASDYHPGADDTEAYDYSGRGFLQLAFTESAQKRILTTEVDNSVESTVSGDGSTGPSKPTRTGHNTMDKVFLLSLSEITSSEYGFNTSAGTSDSLRARYNTSYADGRAYSKNGEVHYMLRTPNSGTDKQKFRYVECEKATSTENVTKEDKGIVPALWVQTGDSFTEDNNTSSTDILWTEWPHTALEGEGTADFKKSTELFGLVGEGYNNGVKGPVIVQQGTLYSGEEDTEGTPVYLITLSGTELIDGQATGIWTDLQSGFNGDSDYLTNIVDIIADNAASGNTEKDTAAIPYGSNLIIAGHSLGGMISQQAAAQDTIKDNYNVLNVVTFGSPLLAEGSREGDLHRICDRSDIIPLASGSIVTSSDKQWNDRELLDGGYGEEIYSTGDLTSHLTAAASGTRDVTGPHCYSYIRPDVWGDYDVMGVKGGTSFIRVDLSTKKFYKNPTN